MIVNPTNIPAELRELRQWVCWKLEPRPGQEKPTKVPYGAKGYAKTTDGKGLPGSAAATWMTFNDAVNLAAQKGYAGIGFVFTARDQYVGIDLDGGDAGDGVFDAAGGVQPDVLEIVRMFPGSYCELSQSKKGIHIIVKGRLPAGGRRKGLIEVYSEGRYFAITGNLFGGSTTGEIVDHTGPLAAFHAQYIGGGDTPVEQKASQPGKVTDQDPRVLDLIKQAKATSSGFSAIFNFGETRPGKSASETDSWMACELAKHSRDVAVIAAVMHASALSRPRWKEHRPNSPTGTLIGLAIADALEKVPVRITSEHHATTSVSASSLMRDGLPKPPPFVVPGLAWRGRLTLVSATEGLGKSTLFAEAAASVTQGRAFLGNGLLSPRGRVLWVLVEEHTDDLLIRAAHFAGPGRRGFGRLRVFERPEEALPMLRAEVERVRPVLVIVDTLHAFAGPLIEHASSSDDWQAVMDTFREIANSAAQPAVLMAAQASKATGDYRDSTAIGHAVDVVFTLTKPGKGSTDDITRELRIMKRRFPVPLTTYQMQGGGADGVVGALVRTGNKVDTTDQRAAIRDEDLEKRIVTRMHALHEKYPDGVPAEPLEGEDGGVGATADVRRVIKQMLASEPPRLLDLRETERGAHVYRLPVDVAPVAAQAALAADEKF